MREEENIKLTGIKVEIVWAKTKSYENNKNWIEHLFRANWKSFNKIRNLKNMWDNWQKENEKCKRRYKKKIKGIQFKIIFGRCKWETRKVLESKQKTKENNKNVGKVVSNENYIGKQLGKSGI